MILIIDDHAYIYGEFNPEEYSFMVSSTHQMQIILKQIYSTDRWNPNTYHRSGVRENLEVMAIK